ncbi:MAG: hypothetical protein AB1597_09405 [Chloroflexota bacterium]
MMRIIDYLPIHHRIPTGTSLPVTCLFTSGDYSLSMDTNEISDIQGCSPLNAAEDNGLAGEPLGGRKGLDTRKGDQNEVH